MWQIGPRKQKFSLHGSLSDLNFGLDDCKYKMEASVGELLQFLNHYTKRKQFLDNN